MKSINLKQLKNYFSYFCSKNIEELKNIFSYDIELKDWNNNFVGKEEVLKEIELIFNSFTSIQLDVVDIYNSIDIIEDGEHLIDIPSGNKFICQIEISFDNKESLRVIDLIEFDNSGKIKNLTAYKR